MQQDFGDVSASVREGHVGVAEIRRPPDNFFDAALIGSLADSLGWLETAGARAVVLCSDGKHFCAGADFTGRSGQARRIGAAGGARELYDEAQRLFEAAIPVIAAVQGAGMPPPVGVHGGLGTVRCPSKLLKSIATGSSGTPF